MDNENNDNDNDTTNFFIPCACVRGNYNDTTNFFTPCACARGNYYYAHVHSLMYPCMANKFTMQKHVQQNNGLLHFMPVLQRMMR